jgi:hypothetical protein
MIASFAELTPDVVAEFRSFVNPTACRSSALREFVGRNGQNLASS